MSEKLSCAWCLERGYSPTHSAQFTPIHGKSVLILGATGLIGSALVEYLAHLFDHAIDVKVIAVGRNRKRLSQRFEHLPTVDLVEWNVGHDSPPAELGEVDYLIHSASSATPAMISRDPVGTMLANFTGTHQALELARDKRSAGVLLVSSAEVYGQTDLDRPLHECDLGTVPLLESRASYPNSKRAAETLAASFTAQEGVRSVVVRPGFVFGPQIGAWDDRVIPQFVRRARSGEPIIMKSDGLVLRSYVFVSDCVTGILTALLHGQAGAAYNIAHPQGELTIREVAEEIGRARSVEIEYANPSHAEVQNRSPVRQTLLNPSALIDLGWLPNIPIEQGLQITVKQFQEVR